MNDDPPKAERNQFGFRKLSPVCLKELNGKQRQTLRRFGPWPDGDLSERRKQSIFSISLLSLKVGFGLEAPLPRILLSDVSCMRNAQQILRHVNVSVHDGGALVLTGSNGSGMTTFLRMLAGFSRPSAAQSQILWNGHDITQSVIFHQYKLQLSWLSFKDAIKEKFTVLDNGQWFEVLEGNQGRSMPALELMGHGKLPKEKARMLSNFNGPAKKASACKVACH